MFLKPNNSLSDFHPSTVIRDWGSSQGYRIEDALTGAAIWGATGSGKSSGPSKHLALGYLAAGLGGLVLSAKSERAQWIEWARATGRQDDLIIFDASARYRFNFLDWEASRSGEGGGLTMNIVSILDELSGAIAGDAGKSENGGDNRFFRDALHHMCINIVDLPLFAGLNVSLPLMRSIVNTAPQNPQQVKDPEWINTSVCAAILREADEKTKYADEDVRADYEECRTYWEIEYPALSEKTRSIIALSFSMLVRPLITRPLRKLFATTTNITPEDTFSGKIILVDLPVQEYRLVGRIANLALKFCFQISVMRRTPPTDGTYLRPVFLWADEAQNFVTEFDAMYQAVARASGGCTVYITQSRSSYRRILGSDDAVDSLLGNLQAKFFCQNTGDTNEWASKLLGERYINVVGTNVGHGSEGNASSGVNRNEQRRYFVEPAAFTTLKRGGPKHAYQVECIVYNGGHLFPTGGNGPDAFLPCKLLTFNQR